MVRARVVAVLGAVIVASGAVRVGSVAPTVVEGRAPIGAGAAVLADVAVGGPGSDRSAPSWPIAPVVVWTRASGRVVPVVPGGTTAADVRWLRDLTDRIVGMLDATAPFAWREAVAELAVGCRPAAGMPCPGGVVAGGDRITIGPGAARWSDATLAYVLRHELAHVWQHATGDLVARRRDLDRIDLGVDLADDPDDPDDPEGGGGHGPGIDPLEAAADCLAAAWGSPTRGNGYLRCPPAGVARMAAVFATVRPGPEGPAGATDAAPR